MHDFRECMCLLWSQKSQMILREVGKVLVRSKVKMYSGGQRVATSGMDVGTSV